MVERAIHRARRGQDLLAALASAWLQLIGTDARRAVALTLLLEYSHPTLTGAVLEETLLPQGLASVAGQRLVPVRTIWRDPLWPVLASSRLPGRDVLHRAADYLVNRGAAERAIPLYLELRDPNCAGRALASEADRLVDLGQWDSRWAIGLLAYRTVPSVWNRDFFTTRLNSRRPVGK